MAFVEILSRPDRKLEEEDNEWEELVVRSNLEGMNSVHKRGGVIRRDRTYPFLNFLSNFLNFIV
jgi:hypothetical protein